MPGICPLPSLPGSCCRMAAQASLLTGIFQPQNLLQHFAIRHAMCWTQVRFLPSYTQE